MIIIMPNDCLLVCIVTTLIAWLCFQKQSVMVERDILFETILLMGFLKTLDEMELAVATNKKVHSKDLLTFVLLLYLMMVSISCLLT